MNLGDSYDLVKRFWAEALGPGGTLYAHPRFVPAALVAHVQELFGGQPAAELGARLELAAPDSIAPPDVSHDPQLHTARLNEDHFDLLAEADLSGDHHRRPFFAHVD